MSQCVYRMYDASDRLLYVGVTGHYNRRMSEHRKSQPWWLSVDRIEHTEYPDRVTAEEAERQAIRSESPRYNDGDREARQASRDAAIAALIAKAPPLAPAQQAVLSGLLSQQPRLQPQDSHCESIEE